MLTDASPPSALDAFGRSLRDLRLSVTDRCNFRCRYCMPRERFQGHDFLARAALLSFEELARVAGIFVDLGVTKLRVTGGEPLLRRGLPRLIELLAGLGVEVALTTNGVLLPGQAQALRQAGLTRLTVSLDALTEETFQKVCDAPGHSVEDVLAGIEAAETAGFGPVKINCVLRRGVNDGELEGLVRHFRGSGHVLRFIEYMDVGAVNGWVSREVVPAAEIVERVRSFAPVESLEAAPGVEVARRYRLTDGSLEFGVISSISAPFCGTCTRARISADGQLYTCLFAHAGHDLKGPLRAGASDPELSHLIREIWRQRVDRYSEQRGVRLSVLRPVEMSFIGG